MPRHRRLRSLAPGRELHERLAAGESFRSLGRAYGVAHTTVADYSRRPEVIDLLKEVRLAQQAEQRALRALKAKERKAEQLLRRRARAEARHDRLLDAWKPPSRPWNSEYAIWLDEHDAPRGLTSKQRWSQNDELANQTVTAGGGIREVIEATGLPTRLAVYDAIDPQLLVRALRNDKRRQPPHPLPSQRLRRLRPDPALITRRAAGESLRQLAADYGVTHTTLSRYFKRATVKKALRNGELDLKAGGRRA